MEKFEMIRIEMLAEGNEYKANVELGAGEVYTKEQLTHIMETAKHLAYYMKNIITSLDLEGE